MRVFLVRHAEAKPGEPDELRPLTDAGRAAARALGERLAQEDPDAVVTSPHLRARETGEAIARAAGLDAVPHDGLGFDATPETLRTAVAGRGGTVVAVAHQPNCSEIVLALTGREVRFAPGDVQELEL
ncbi:MAG TPA: histidine phosphatase family protein [Gaiellaceae bacterium]|nr:histidine phosphatase family protein [Gaiellaceae bacterium]